MRNKLSDLNNHLFEQLERLNDEELSEEQFEKECKRAKAITEVAKNIIENGKLILDATKYTSEYSYGISQEPLENLLQDKIHNEQISIAGRNVSHNSELYNKLKEGIK